jgi:NAD-dependent dihydropyrimidine dehydrogenase PreA subunit
MNTIKFDDEKCIGCKKCYKSCWLDVIRWNNEKRRPVAAYPEDCVECNFCEVVCDQNAVNVIIDYTRPFPEPYFAHSTKKERGLE